jgi:RecJ-like exonuclease
MTQDTNEPSGASGGSTVSVGQELVSRLKALNDRLALGESFERVTRIRCDACNGAGYVYGHGMCPRCGGNGARERRERIDPTNVRFESDGLVVVTNRRAGLDTHQRGADDD